MSLAGQLIIMGLPGPELNSGLRTLIQMVQPGGFIFFGRNLANPSQFFNLLSELNGLCQKPPIFTIDQEGGRVARLSRFTPQAVSAGELAQYGDEALCRRHGELTGELLRLFGLNLNLAPVVDLSTPHAKLNSLRERCFGISPQDVIARAGAFLEGMQERGVWGTIKHFPGYAYAEVDPHGELPIVWRSLKEMEEEELAIFQALIQKSEVEAVMVGHGSFPALQENEPAELPASLSPNIIQKLLRDKMKYSGLVMSDDLEMGAIAERYGMARTTELAIEAGQDLLLICHNPACVQIAYDKLVSMPVQKLERALNAVSKFKEKLLPMPEKFDSAAFEKICTDTEALRTQVKESVGNRNATLTSV